MNQMMGTEMMKNNRKGVLPVLAGICCALSGQVWSAEFVVTHTDDPVPQACSVNSCSLREAVIAANNNPGPDTILLPAEEHVLTLAGVDDTAHTGDLDVLDDLVIRHVAPQTDDRFGITADMNDRVFDVHAGVSLTIYDGLINGGKAQGAGGAIIATGAEVWVENSVLANNSANNGGALFLNQSHAVMNAVALINNQAGDKGGGIMVTGVGSQLLMDEMYMAGNEARNGGGLYFGYLESNNSQPNIHITNSDFLGNVADWGGALNAQGSFGETTGGILIENTAFILNRAKNRGGAIFHIETQLTIKHSSFNTNQAESNNPFELSDGGAIYSGMPFQAGDTADLSIENSLFESNQATGKGGGLHLADNNARITNTTFSGNSAGSHAAISAVEGDLALVHVTVAGNESIDEVAVMVGVGASGNIQNSIISGRCQLLSFTGFESLGGNVESPGDSCDLGAGSNDLTGVAARFLKLDHDLADNGGPTSTHAIRYIESVAIGNAIPINSISHDQRLMSRDDMPDSGAFEVHDGDLILIFKNSFE